MAINRRELVTSHNPVFEKADFDSPLTVGNGELGFTADITGMQTFYEEYKDVLPLCTMSQWGWHTKPVSETKYQYTLDDVVMTEYDYNGRTVVYPKKKMPGNEEVYDWLRENPHRLNLGRIGFIYKDKPMALSKAAGIHQELKLYEGVLESSFSYDGYGVKVQTACDDQSDTLGFLIESEAFQKGLAVAVEFPYGSPKISASDWESPKLHKTETVVQKAGYLKIKRTLDRDIYYVIIKSDACSVQLKGHQIILTPSGRNFRMTAAFRKEDGESDLHADQVMENSRNYWKHFWEKGGMVKLSESEDERALELERRIILSQYLSAVNSCGSAPPQETGLTCNSWYGKMHLEMYLWHCAWTPLWNRTELLERSLPWYVEHIKEAEENAARNGYKGARWPKMIASEGIDCPSAVAPLLIWQQPHIIYMLELAYQQNHSREFLEKYWVLIEKTAEFMVDLAVYNQETGKYDLISPVIPVQECHRPEDTKNPAFEVEYWRFTLRLSVEWAQRLGKEYDPMWKNVGENMAEVPGGNGLYLAHELCPDTFEKFNHDHPSMLGAFGLLPSDRIDKTVMRATLNKVMECWNYPSLWGWDFAVMAMTAVRLGEPELAIDVLMKETLKNSYVASGNNLQKSRKDLPLYLPGNGALLLAIPIMTAGYIGCTEELPGFPKNGKWKVEFEDIEPYFE